MKTRLFTEHPSNTERLWFWCPGCNRAHAVYVSGPDAWAWNGDAEKPTIHPSVLCRGVLRCHSFIENGRIRFLQDSDHEMAGRTVDLPDIPKWLAEEE